MEETVAGALVMAGVMGLMALKVVPMGVLLLRLPGVLIAVGALPELRVAVFAAGAA